ncbi:MAG: hypothetical protein DMF49_09540 [Acidobacteria bacterium]|nr:MAG: hypothetical protein DMF49_09540 [Acidobacteriota bacterium]
MRRRRDPRLYQISVLSLLLAYGFFRLGFDVMAAQIAVTLGAALGAQYACSRLWRLAAFEPKSALISGLSLCLLLRTNLLTVATATAVAAIASKFLIRWNGKHVFNPTNVGLAAAMLSTGKVWVSPGQWGSVAFAAFFFACLGGLVVHRAARSDVTYAFLLFYVSLVAGRSFWLGEPLAIPVHRLESGAFLLFAFFMIWDPKTTPDSRAGRVLFALLVAFGGWYVQYRLFRTNGLIWSLAAFSPFVPVIDRFLPAERYRWSGAGRLSRSPTEDSLKGAFHETQAACIRVSRPPGPVDPVGARLLRFLRGQGGHEALQQGFAGGPRP